jgi:hypothetical protein
MCISLNFQSNIYFTEILAVLHTALSRQFNILHSKVKSKLKRQIVTNLSISKVRSARSRLLQVQRYKLLFPNLPLFCSSDKTSIVCNLVKLCFM